MSFILAAAFGALAACLAAIVIRDVKEALRPRVKLTMSGRITSGREVVLFDTEPEP